MRSQTTSMLLLIVNAVLIPIIALVPLPTAAKVALILVQYICLLLVGLNIQPPVKPDDHNENLSE